MSGTVRARCSTAPAQLLLSRRTVKGLRKNKEIVFSLPVRGKGVGAATVKAGSAHITIAKLVRQVDSCGSLGSQSTSRDFLPFWIASTRRKFYHIARSIAATTMLAGITMAHPDVSPATTRALPQGNSRVSTTTDVAPAPCWFCCLNNYDLLNLNFSLSHILHSNLQPYVYTGYAFRQSVCSCAFGFVCHARMTDHVRGIRPRDINGTTTAVIDCVLVLHSTVHEFSRRIGSNNGGYNHGIVAYNHANFRMAYRMSEQIIYTSVHCTCG